MSSIAVGKFTCDQCGKNLAWKPQLAGKRAKCKCGAIVTVPATLNATATAAPTAPVPVLPSTPVTAAPKVRVPVIPASKVTVATAVPAKPRVAAPAKVPVAAKSTAPAEPQLDDLYALAPDGGSIAYDEEAPPPLAPILAPALHDPAPRRPKARGGRTGAAIGYQSGPGTAVRKDRFSADNLTDPTRDIYAPAGIFAVGFLLYVGYYAFKYDLSGAGIAMACIGLGLITAFKAVLLIVAAMVLAGPLGVSFGGVWTASLKLAAIAAFSDGVTTWVDAGLQAGGAGGLSSLISFPVALAVYWGMLIYLFSMDPGDSWLVVMILSVFDSFVRWGLLLLLLNSVMSLGGAAGTVAGITGGGGGTRSDGSAASEARAHVQDMKDGGFLHEADEYAAKGRSTMMMEQVKAWYAAGAKHVWFETGARDINGKSELEGIVVELPDDPAKRAACFKILNDFYAARDPDSAGDPVVDDGEDPYLRVPAMSRF